MKKLILLIVVIALVGGGVWFYRQRAAKAAAAAENGEQLKAPPITVMKGKIDLQVPTTGKLISNLDVEIKSKASGQILRLPFDVSDKITSGNLLCELDPVDEKRNVSQREAALSSSQARLIQAREELKISELDRDTRTSSTQADLANAVIRNRDAQARLERAKELYDRQLVSKEEFDAARTEASNASNSLLKAQLAITDIKSLSNTIEIRRQSIKLNEASLQQSSVDLENAQQRLRETKIFAPMNGVLTSRPVQPGQIIASGVSNVGGGTTLMTLSDMSQLFVMANVDESDIGKVKPGQRCIITADAFAGKRFNGKVVRIAAKGVNNSNVVTFEVKIEVTGEGVNVLKPEMTTNVIIQAERREDALLLPNEAIQFDRTGYYVDTPVGNDDTTRSTQRIKIGITDGINTEILEGLSENDDVLLPAVLASKWVQGQAQAGGGNNLQRGMQRATFSLSRGGRR
ncbi:hypothetical protein CVU37_03995 [candidate division BRC1 bacterium HGW-BRC1-1]|jgi:HlyD family secretion protein|nr:MAG: hypothetical protein CVU37_03995 [candidate division BRC1 bacterium HGW-BRC1-1]